MVRIIKIIDNCKAFHFIGIGGVNMSALAELLFKSGYVVTGSDRRASEVTARLIEMGINVKIGHSPANVAAGTEVAVYNAAVPKGNAELVAAKNRGLILMDRAELLGRLMKNYQCPICVAGTHGKTTVTSMLAEIFMQAQADPTVVNGGFLPSTGGSLRIGGKKYFIAESCEFHDSFLKFNPYIGIILNVEMDHSDYFKDEAQVAASFRKFAQLIPGDGALVINSGIRYFEEITDCLSCKIIPFGNYEGPLAIPGEHTKQNAMAAAAVALELGLNRDDIAAALSNFKGALRRYQIMGNVNGAQIIDDYAHHPSEIAATLTAVKNICKGRLWAVFQPHTRTRTAQFFDEFAQSLLLADKVIILDIFHPAGREEEGTPITAEQLARKINCPHMPDFSAAAQYLKENIRPNDIVITMGAGDVGKLAQLLTH